MLIIRIIRLSDGECISSKGYSCPPADLETFIKELQKQYDPKEYKITREGRSV